MHAIIVVLVAWGAGMLALLIGLLWMLSRALGAWLA